MVATGSAAVLSQTPHVNGSVENSPATDSVTRVLLVGSPVSHEAGPWDGLSEFAEDTSAVGSLSKSMKRRRDHAPVLLGATTRSGSKRSSCDERTLVFRSERTSS